MKNADRFQLCNKQLWELLDSIFQLRFELFSQQPVQFWVHMGQKMRTDDVFCVCIAEIENKSKITWPLAFTLFTFVYLMLIFVFYELISLGIDK